MSYKNAKGQTQKPLLLNGQEFTRFQDGFSVANPLLQDVILEIQERMSPEKREQMKVITQSNPAFNILLKRTILSLTSVLMFAKTMQKDTDFIETFDLLDGRNLSANNNLLLDFTIEMIKSDSDGDEEMHLLLKGCVAPEVLKERLNLLVEHLKSICE